MTPSRVDSRKVTEPVNSISTPSPAFRNAMEAMLNVLPDPIFVKDRSHRWVIVNDAFCQFTGRSRDWLYGKSDYDYSGKEEADVFWEKDNEVFVSGAPNINMEAHTDTAGNRRVIETKKSLLTDPEGNRFLIGVIRDLTELTTAKADLEQANRELEQKIHDRTHELRQTNAALENIAFFDPLTGLPNRRLLLDTLDLLLQSKSVGVLFFDLDEFKRMNDARGHTFGDEILRVVAERLRNLKGFSLVSRLGGDEFVAVAEAAAPLNERVLTELARSVQQELTQPVNIDGHELTMTASIGISASPRDGTSATDLIQHADTAMYRAKHQGRDQYAFFDAELGSHAKEYGVFEEGLRTAIRMQRIAVALQPILATADLKTVGFEALARWRDPVLGDIPPDRFIPVCEVTGLIYDLGLTVMEQAFRLAPARLATAMPNARLAVNLSGRQLARDSFLHDLKRLLERTGFPAERLEFEITENSATNLSEATRVNLIGLRKMKISIALDDFGTGFSSLAHLQQMPIDRIKIDRGFVSEIPHDARTSTLVEAMIRMTQALELKVVAEGVENTDQLAFLTRLGCDEVQGFLLGRPTLLT